ncbi:potassium-transporting ATPase subunit F [Agrobacterium vitis]|nr:potassium-transporting ATPase subunit F [Agrobacterium vitis]
MFEHLLGLGAALFICVYLLITLIRPERF